MKALTYQGKGSVSPEDVAHPAIEQTTDAIVRITSTLGEDPADPLGVTDLVTHTVPLEQAPERCGTLRKKQDGCITVMLKP